MTLKDFCSMANTYYSVDCNISNDSLIDAVAEEVARAYHELSKEDKEVVMTLCDARLADLL